MSRATVGALVAGVCFGLMAGGSLVYEMMPAKEPRPCEIARELSDDYIYVQADIINSMGERDRATTRQEWDAETDKVRGYLEELRKISAPYHEAYDDCEAVR